MAPPLEELPLQLIPLGLNTASLVWGALYVLLGIFALYSLLLLYHWLRYGRDYSLIWTGMTIYFGISTVFIIGLLLSALALT